MMNGNPWLKVLNPFLKYKFLVVVVGTGLGLILFQNCSRVSYVEFAQMADKLTTNDMSGTGTGNGAGYDGKLDGEYLAFDRANPCGLDQQHKGLPKPNAIVSVKASRPKLLAKNCVAIEPVDLGISELKFSEYNFANFSVDGLNFERNSDPGALGILGETCRGWLHESASLSKGVDALLRFHSDNHISAQIIVAEGSPGSGKSYLITSSSTNVQLSSDGPSEIYQSLNSTFHLKIETLSRQGQLSLQSGSQRINLNVDCKPQVLVKNKIAYSEDLTRGEWTIATKSTLAKIEAAPEPAPDGTNTAFSVIDDSSTNPRSLRFFYLDVAPTDTATRTFSAFLKKGNTFQTVVNIGYSGATNPDLDVGGSLTLSWSPEGVPSIADVRGSVLNSGIVDSSNGWYRVHVTLKNNGLGNFRHAVNIVPAGYGVSWQDNTPVGNILAWGFQIVEGELPLSYEATFANSPLLK